MQMNDLPSKRNSRSDIGQPFRVKNKAKSFLPRTQNSLLEPSEAIRSQDKKNSIAVSNLAARFTYFSRIFGRYKQWK